MITAQEAYKLTVAKQYEESYIKSFLGVVRTAVQTATEKGVFSCAIPMNDYKRTDLSETYASLKMLGYYTTFKVDKSTGFCKQLILSWSKEALEDKHRSCTI